MEIAAYFLDRTSYSKTYSTDNPASFVAFHALKTSRIGRFQVAFCFLVKTSFCANTFHIKLRRIYIKINTLVEQTQQMVPYKDTFLVLRGERRFSRKWPIALPGRSKGGWGEEERSHQQLNTLISHVIRHQLSGHPAFGQTDSSAKSSVMLLYSTETKQQKEK